VSATLTVEERKKASKKLIAAASDAEMKTQRELQEVAFKRAALVVSIFGDEDDG
jgi:hypothetical protein